MSRGRGKERIRNQAGTANRKQGFKKKDEIRDQRVSKTKKEGGMG